MDPQNSAKKGQPTLAVSERGWVLKAAPYFAGLDSRELGLVESSLHRVSLPRDEMALWEGQPSDRLYFVAQGRMKVFKTSAEGREQILRLLHAGDSFNEVAVFDGGPAPVSAAALEPTVLYYLRRQDILRLVSRYPAVAQAIIEHLAARLRHLASLVEDLSFRHVTSRLAKLLLTYAQTGPGGKLAPGLKERLTRQEMAAMVGTAREIISRSLAELERQGAIRMERQRIIIVNRSLLEQLS